MRKKKLIAGYKKRLLTLGMLFMLAIAAVLFRAFHYQVVNAQPWRDMAQKQYQHWVRLIAKRGIIYDRDMNILAMDQPILSVAADPTKLRDVNIAAEALVKIIGGSREAYIRAMQSKPEDEFVWLKKDITQDQQDQIIQLEMDGIIPVRGRKRVHPYGQLARQVIGVTNAEHEGIGGVEQEMNPRLMGQHGWAIYQKDASNQNHSSLDYPIEKPVDGTHVVLTIDHACQTIIEEEISRGVSQYQAKGGFGILMDPFTGEILAMASTIGERKLSEVSNYEARLLNQAVQFDYEPGSTFKIVTAAAALEENLYKSNSLIHCENGAYTIMGRTIHDHDKKYGLLTLNQIMENSSNIGMAKIGSKLGEKTLYRYIQNFGFGNRSGIQLPGDVPGILRPIYEWSRFSLAAISFGQELSVTGVQMIAMMSAVANGGELLKPRIIQSIMDEKDEIKRFHKVKIRRVVSEKTTEELKNMLFNVVENGTGYAARVEGMQVAGKTGTAEKSVPGYKGYVPGAHVSSFIGFWPYDTPIYTMLIVLDEPRVAYWGSTSAAPVFARIVERITGLPHSRTPKQPWLMNPKEEKKFIFIDMKPEVNEAPKRTGLSDGIDSPYHLPDLRGLSMREALERLADQQIEARIQGHGEVIYQQPEPGYKITPDMVCLLYGRTTE